MSPTKRIRESAEKQLRARVLKTGLRFEPIHECVYIHTALYRKPRVAIIKCMDVYLHKDNTKTVSQIQRISDLYTRIHTGVIFLWVCAV